MRYLLDTNICIYFLNENANIVEKIGRLSNSEMAISIITLAELQFGAHNSSHVSRNLERIAFLTSTIAVLPLTSEITDRYAQIKALLRKIGQPVDDFDILIGATAIANSITLVTNNTQHFERMDGIVLENWMESSSLTDRR